MSKNIEQYRPGFEAWLKTRPGYPFAAAFANLMWDAWAFAKIEANNQPDAIRNAALEEAARLMDWHDEPDYRGQQGERIRKLKGGTFIKSETSTEPSYAPEYAATPIGRAIEADRIAFEAHIGYNPERIASKSHPWGCMYSWRDTQDAFRNFCKRSKDEPSSTSTSQGGHLAPLESAETRMDASSEGGLLVGAAPGDALDAGQKEAQAFQAYMDSIKPIVNPMPLQVWLAASREGWSDGMQEATELLAEEIADAARYRWLRDFGDEGKPSVFMGGRWYGAKLGNGVGFELDSALDAAIAASTVRREG